MADGAEADLHRFGIEGEAAVCTRAAAEDGRSMTCPQLLEHVSRHDERDAGILNEARTAPERRALTS